MKPFVLSKVWRKIIVHGRELKVRLQVTWRSFPFGQTSQHAASLTYYSVMSVVPLLALVFGVSKGLGLDKLIHDGLSKTFIDQPETVDTLVEFANKALDNAQGGIIAGLGVLALIWSIMKIVNAIEWVFATIWHGHKKRPFVRRFTGLVTAIMLGPLFLLTIFSGTSFLQQLLVDSLSGQHLLIQALNFLFSLVSYIVICGGLTFLYFFFPNTKVKISSAVLGGFVAGTLFVSMQSIYFYFQSQFSSVGEIYGVLVALPLFLLWVFLSWTIILFGAQLTYLRDYSGYLQTKQILKDLSFAQFRLLSLIILRKVIVRFEEGKPIDSGKELATALELPSSLTEALIEQLQRTGLIVIASQGEKDSLEEGKLYPAVPTHSLTMQKVVEVLENLGEGLPLEEKSRMGEEDKDISRFLEQWHKQGATIADQSILPNNFHLNAKGNGMEK